MICRCLLLTGLLLFSPMVQAEVFPVQMQLEAVNLRQRSNSPIGIRVKLEYQRRDLLEGDLQLRLFDGQRHDQHTLGMVTYDGIVLQQGDTFLDLLLPPLRESNSGSIELEAWFVTEQGRIPLSASSEVIRGQPDTFSLVAHSYGNRGVLVASVSGQSDPARPTPRRRKLERLLSPDRLLSEYAQQRVVYHASPQAAIDLPEDPLALCSYDVALLSEGALETLQSSQLEALARWTEAGGSVCLAPSDRPLQSRHLEFLQRVFPRYKDQWLLQDDGRLMSTEGEFDGLHASYCGLGRSVLLPLGIDPLQDLSEDEKNWIRCFLWRYRGSRLPADGISFAKAEQNRTTIQPRKESDSEFEFGFGSGGFGGGRRSASRGYDWEELAPNTVSGHQSGGALPTIIEDLTMPRDSRLVPGSVVAVLLIGYILAIGPLDYFVLGWLKLRKLTWVLFPVVTVVFTTAMLLTAQHYMTSQTNARQLVISDVADGGKVVRSSVIDLQYSGGPQNLEREYRSQLVTALPPYPLQLSGRFPAVCTTKQQLEQWTPQLQRTMTFGPTELPPLGIDWQDSRLVTTQEGHQQLQTLLGSGDSRCLAAAILHGADGIPLLKTRHLLLEVDKREPGLWEAELSFHDGHYDESGNIDAVLLETSRAGCRHWFRYVSQMSPGGAANLEDLPLLDTLNPDQWLLVVLLETDEGYHLIRRLYCQPEIPTPAAATHPPTQLEVHDVPEHEGDN